MLSSRPMNRDALDYPATHRNQEPITNLLRDLLPADGSVLEIASGSGQHCAHLARLFPDLRWQPSDRDKHSLSSISAWTESITNVLPPVSLDACESDWHQFEHAAILCINMIHIAPWAACEGLMRGAKQVLPMGGFLYMYGPYMRAGRHTSKSNARFSEDLQKRDERWGVRELNRVESFASDQGLHLDKIVQMPANNLSLVFRRTSGLHEL